MSRERKFSPHSLLLASTLLMPFYLDRAQAACVPDPPADNATASCTGPTTDQSGTNGYGTISLSNNTITVQPGASVVGTDNGIVLSTGSVANFGSISTASNNGVFVVGTGAVTNSGLIDGGNNGASITNGSVTNTNTGIISGGNVGVFFQDQGLAAGSPPNVTNAGAITGSQFGIQFAERNQRLGGVVANSGTISATVTNGIGISARTTMTVTNDNSGVISGQKFGIDASTANVTNAGRIESTDGSAATSGAVHATIGNISNLGLITSPSFGVQTSGLATINNSGTIESTARIAIFAGSADIDNSGTIQAPAGQSALSTPGTATVKNSGLFVGGSNAIFSSGGLVEVTGNTGTIRAIDSDGRAINAATVAAVTNSAGGVIEANGADGKAIQAGTLAAVTNSGLIQGLGITGNAVIGATVDVTNFGTIQAPNNVAISSGIGDMFITNFGAITGGAAAASAAGTLDVFNAATGTLRATSTSTQSAFTISGFDVLLKNAGLIETSGSANMNVAVFAPNNATIESSGNIRASGTGSAGVVSVGGTADVRNSGSIQQEGDGGAGIVGGEIANVNNSGSIQTTGQNGIAIFSPGLATGGFADVTNSGTISATAAGGVAISAGIVGGNVGSAVTVNNLSTGTILADTQAVVSNTGSANITNAGTIQTIADGSRAISTSTTGTIDNSGTIQSAGAGSAAIFGNGLITVTNSRSGSISAAALGVASALDEVKVENAGTIETTSGGIAIQAATTATVDNIGTIRASGDGTAIAANIANVTNAGLITGGFFGIDAASVNLINTGTISTATGIRASGLNNVGSTITNSGTIAGTGGTAIKLSPAADTLTLLPGSKIIGAIDMGGGADIINIVNNAPVLSRVSSFFKFLSVNSFNIINFTGTINANAVTVNTGGMPAVQTADNIATLDPTAFGRADRALMNFTGGISSLVQGRLGGTAANVSAMQVVSFAPTGASGRTEEAFAANSGMSALGYAAERPRPLTHSFTYADAPYNVWTSGFGGTSTQKGDNTMLRSIASAGAGVIGVDRQVRPDLLIGAFAGGGAGRLSVELNSQSIDTDYVTGGVYGRFDWVGRFLDFTLQGGATTNKSKRLVLNDSAPGGSETATASYDSWYISPEIAYGRRYHFADGYTLTPVGRIRYLAGTFDGYNETGSAQNLTVGRRNLHDLEERAEVELSKITGVGVGNFRTSVHGGLIALQRLGNPTINTVLIGQDLAFTTPGKASTVGVAAGAGFDFRATDRMSLFGAFEATLMSDHTRTATAKAGLKLAF